MPYEGSLDYNVSMYVDRHIKSISLSLFIFIFTFCQTTVTFANSLASLPKIELENLPEFFQAPDFNYDIELKDWVQCANKLKDCRKASFDLPNPVQVSVLRMAVIMSGGKKMNGSFYTQEDINELKANAYQKYTILGWKQDNCMITIEAKPYPENYTSGYQLDDSFVKEMFPITKVKCGFSKKELEILSQSAAQMTVTDRNNEIDEKAAEILGRSCHSY